MSKKQEKEPEPKQITVPQRPGDPLGSFLWDLTYGIGAKANPVITAGDKLKKLDSVKEGVVKELALIYELNENIKELIKVLHELNKKLDKIS